MATSPDPTDQTDPLVDPLTRACRLNYVEFCRELGRHLAQMLDARAGRQLWFIDQNALYHVWLLCRLRGVPLRVLDFAASALPGDLRFSKL